MRSFMGRDILSLRISSGKSSSGCSRSPSGLEPIARNRRNSDMLKDKTW